MTLVKQLIHYRQKRQLTQEQLAHQLMVERQCIANYEQGLREPDLKTLFELGTCLGVDILTRGGEVRLYDTNEISFDLSSQDKLEHLSTHFTSASFETPYTFAHFIQDIVFEMGHFLEVEPILGQSYDNTWSWVLPSFLESDDLQHNGDFYLPSFMKPMLATYLEDYFKNTSFSRWMLKGASDTQTPFEITFNLTFEPTDELLEQQQEVVQQTIQKWLSSSSLRFSSLHESLVLNLIRFFSPHLLTSCEVSHPHQNLTFAERLKQIRQYRGLSQSNLAALMTSPSDNDKIAMSQRISQYELGKRQPKLKTLKQLLKALNYELLIRQGGEYFFISCEDLPTFITPQDHVEAIKNLLTPFPSNPNEAWKCFTEEEDYFDYCSRDFSNFLKPKAYREFYEKHYNDELTPELKTQIMVFFEQKLIDKLIVEDTDERFNQTYQTCLHFKYRDEAEVYRLQREGVEELFEWCEECAEEQNSSPKLIDFDQYFYQTFGFVIANYQIAEIECFAVTDEDELE